MSIKPKFQHFIFDQRWAFRISATKSNENDV